jgi:predicted metalloprotease
MDFRDRARLDTSRVSDVRGRGGRRGGGRGLAVGGGGLGLVGLVIALLLGVSPADLTGAGGDVARSDPYAGDPYGAGPQAGVTADGTDLAERCQTGADADRDETCRIVGVVNSLEDYWSQALQGFRPPATQIFGQATSTGCGNATSAVGPFYCPADEGIYLDPGFFDELQRSYGARGGDFAQAYVLAHEYGHHVQTLTGASELARRGDQEGPQSGSVRLELQADCYAGVWAANASVDGFITFDDTDVVEGLSAAAAVGDDRIQERSAGRVDPESWTHGSAEQRQQWFRTGLSTGDPNACDTFSAPSA